MCLLKLARSFPDFRFEVPAFGIMLSTASLMYNTFRCGLLVIVLLHYLVSQVVPSMLCFVSLLQQPTIGLAVANLATVIALLSNALF